jgi:hypothetical protein
VDDDDIEMILAEIDEVEEVPATPWHNSDTAATAFRFAADIASAAADHFTALSKLALGQSAQEWADLDKQEFIEDSIETIKQLPEGGEQDG